MPKSSLNASRRAWSLVQLMLLRSRKGGLFRRQLAVQLRLVPKFFKKIGRINGDSRRNRIGYMMERELSFDKTPVVHIKMHRPHSLLFHVPRIPCINPRIDFDYDFHEEDGAGGTYGCETWDGELEDDIRENDEDGEGIDVDLRAEEFIAKFYEQMKLQRHVSYLQDNNQ